MNFKKYAEKLEKVLDDELSKKIPLLIVNKNYILYKNYKIRKNKIENWELQDQTGRIIEIFKLKINAALAAKFYDKTQLHKFDEIKDLDRKYWTNLVDSLIFKDKIDKTKDIIKKDIYISRWDIARVRTNQYKLEITKLFSYNFG